MARPYKLVDLFSGAGGMTLGFRRAGFEPVLAVEREPDFADTYRANFGAHVLTADIADIVDTGGIRVGADVVIGGPPCQGFSNLTGNRADDPRRSMWRFYMDAVAATGAKAFVIENVPNLLTAPEGKAIVEAARQAGFHVGTDSVGVLKAEDFGVPQRRRRAFIIGSRLGEVNLPAPTGRTTTVREALAGVPDHPLHDALPERRPVCGADLHVGRRPTTTSLQRYKLVPPGGNRFDLQRAAPSITPDCWIRKKTGGTDLFGRLEWDTPARCTIRCEFYKPEKGRYLHPEQHRPITHWEAARLQGFPDDFAWCGTKIRIAVQIGNAVPPPLAEAVARQVMAHLERHGVKPSPAPKPAALEQSAFAFG